MEVTNQTKLKFLGVDFPMVNLYSEKPLTESKQIELDINPSVFYPKDLPNDFKIIQDIKISVGNKSHHAQRPSCHHHGS